jgi:hypothetical protein
MVDPTQILEKRGNTLLPYKMKTTDRLSPLLLPSPSLGLITTRSFLLCGMRCGDVVPPNGSGDATEESAGAPDVPADRNTPYDGVLRACSELIS